jgi:arylsulfatase A-like enzyme
MLPGLVVLAGLGAALVVAGTEAWRAATEHAWLDAGYHRLVCAAFWLRFDRVAPVALAVAVALLATAALLRRRWPDRRALAIPAALVVATLAARGGAAIADGLGPPRPNVLLLSIDTLRPDRLGTYGYTRPTSPALDARLTAGGVVFENAWSQSPKTTPSHMTMLTSLYPAVHGVGLWKGEGAAPALNPRVHTLAEALKNAGYVTAAFTAGGHMHRDRGFVQGFDLFKHGDQLARLLAFIEIRRRRPLFAFFHTYEVHDPYVPPAEVARSFVADPVPAITAAVERVRAGIDGWGKGHRLFWAPVDASDPRHVRHVSDLYDAGIRHMDDGSLTAILDLLERRGLAGDTLVVFTSDHGEAFQEHGLFLHEDLSPEVLRVPLVLRWPGRLPSGRRVPAPVGLVDLPPTVLELVGLPPLPDAQGASVAGLADGSRTTGGPAAVFAEFSLPDRRYEAVRRDGLTVARDRDVVTAWDHTVDPGELTPLRPEPIASTAALRAALDRWHAANATLATRLGPRTGDVSAPSPATVEQLRALGYVE